MKTMIKAVVLLAAAAVCRAQAATTLIQGTLQNEDGTPVNCDITIEWPSFQPASGPQVQGGQFTYPVAGGVYSIPLIPTTNATQVIPNIAPQYVVKTVNQGTTEYTVWLVPPSSTPLTIADVQTSAPAGLTYLINPSQVSTQGATGLGQCFVTQGSPLTAGWGSCAGNAVWGGITGTLADQTDLESALSAKQNALGYTPLNPGNNLNDVDSGPSARANLGLAIGVNVEAWSANLDLWSALAPSAKQNALGFTPENAANKNQASGYAGLNSSGQLTQDTTGNAGTATKLAATPSQCGSGSAPQGVDVQGNAQNCQIVGGGSSLSAPFVYFPWPIGNLGSTAVVPQNGAVKYFGFTTSAGITLDHIALGQGGSSSNHIAFAIYNAGCSLLFSSSAAAFTGGSNIGLSMNGILAAATTYFLAVSSDSTNNTDVYVTIGFSGSFGPFTNVAGTFVFTGSNPASWSGGTATFPSACGSPSASPGDPIAVMFY